MIRFSCPVCGNQLSGPDDAAGNLTNCPACGERIRIPGSPPTPLPKANPAPPPNPISAPPAAAVVFHRASYGNTGGIRHLAASATTGPGLVPAANSNVPAGDDVKVEPERQKKGREKAVETALCVILGLSLLSCSGMCVFAPFGKFEDKWNSPGSSRQTEAYEKMQRGEKLSDLDVHDLANRPEPDTANAQKERGWTAFWAGLICLALPGACL